MLALFVAGALVTAAVLAHAPVAVLPLLIAVVVTLPLIAARELPTTLAMLHRGLHEGRVVSRMRRELDRLPETHHPLGH